MSLRIIPPLLILMLATGLSFAATGGEWGPWNVEGEERSPSVRSPEATFDPLKAGVRFFQKFISPVDGPRCPMSPTCSAYALQALDKHGPLIGAMMTVDRLFHENDPRERRHPVDTGHRVRYADPVENNDFWFTDP